jgi:hypothetical protein
MSEPKSTTNNLITGLWDETRNYDFQSPYYDGLFDFVTTTRLWVRVQMTCLRHFGEVGYNDSEILTPAVVD